MKFVQLGEINYEIDEEVVKLLLLDQTTRKNIIFACKLNEESDYKEASEITLKYLKKEGNEIINRISKSKDIQKRRSKDNAEVFTPSWICNKQNNLIDNEWFKKENVFNTEKDKEWITNYSKIEFVNKTWEDYINDIRLEITCGEAPYLTSRYDVVNGKIIKLEDRIGLLDRKLRIVNENCNEKDIWIKYALKAYKSIYGYEFQGDNLLIARENLLFTFIDNYRYKFNEEPSLNLLKDIALVISFNVFQMDGLKGVIPYSCHKVKNEKYIMTDLFGDTKVIGKEDSECPGCLNNEFEKHNGTYVKIKDWEKNKMIEFKSLIKNK